MRTEQLLRFHAMCYVKHGARVRLPNHKFNEETIKTVLLSLKPNTESGEQLEARSSVFITFIAHKESDAGLEPTVGCLRKLGL